jgi:hypothetical protein
MAERKAVRSLLVALVPGAENFELVKKELIDKGHDVRIIPCLDEYDLILGTNAHRLWEGNEKLLPLAIKSARQRVYGQKGNKRK